MSSPTFASLQNEYARLWAAVEIRASKQTDIDATAKKVVASKNGRYKAVASETGVPWFVVGIIHQLECGGSFRAHLHNGDPLTCRTVQVPKGRPLAGAAPFAWKDSACDAIRYDGLDKVSDWGIERILYELERYNGFGYRSHHPEVNTPYLWSGTNHYARGKYVADGKWSADAVSGQSGAAAILKRVMELDPEVAPALASKSVAPVEERVADPALAFPKAEPKAAPIAATVMGSPTLMAKLMAGVMVVLGLLKDWVSSAIDWASALIDGAPTIVNETKEQLDSMAMVFGWFKLNWADMAMLAALVCLCVAGVRYLNKKRNAA